MQGWAGMHMPVNDGNFSNMWPKAAIKIYKGVAHYG